MTTACKRGHERNAENSRQRTVNSGGVTRVITECLACARAAAEARRNRAASQVEHGRG